MKRLSVGKSAAYIYVELIVVAFSGYILWLILSKITTPDVIGSSSTVVSLAIISASIVSFGIPNGLPRHLGKMFSEQKFDDAKMFVRASILLTTIGIIAASVVIVLIKDYGILKNLGIELIVLWIVLMGSLAIATLYRYIVISSLRTKALVSRQIISSSAKVGLSIMLIWVGMGTLGLVMAFTFSQVMAAILTGLVVIHIFKLSRANSTRVRVSIRQACKSVITAGIPSWVPISITSIGFQAGTIFIFGVSGSSQAGTYFIAFSLMSAILLIASSLLSAAFPRLSAMQDGRKRLAWRMTKVSLIISLPISSLFIFYSADILGLLGPGYVGGSTPLAILLLSVLPNAVMTGVNFLVYAYGNYRQVLIIGIASSAPRIILYFILVPIYDGTGAGLSFTVGSIIGFLVSLGIARKVGFMIFWRELYSMFGVSIGVAISLFYLEINYLLSVPLALLVSYVLLMKLKVITRLDIQDIVGILPARISDRAIKFLNGIGKRLSQSY